MADTTIKTFDDITDRLDEIVAAVRSKDTSLERSLDLFDEAIKLGSRAVSIRTNPSAAQRALKTAKRKVLPARVFNPRPPKRRLAAI